MFLKKSIPAVAALLVVFFGSCKKEATTTLSSGLSSTESAAALQLNQSVTGLNQVFVNPAVVNLGIAGNFVILSKTGITDVYKSAITGDIGTSPITGAAMVISCPEVTGTIYSADAAGPACKVTSAPMLSSAIGDMQTAYTDAAGRINPDFLNLGAGDIGGKTLTPGLYKWTSALKIPTDITISGAPTDVWIFQVAGTLTMSSAVNITLEGGAQAKNIFWQTSGAVTIGTTSHFEGVVLSQTGINFKTGASINGRLLAQTAVTLQMNAVTRPQ